MTKITSAGDLQSIAKAYNDAKAGFSHHIYTCGGGACVSSGCIATRDAVAEYLKEKNLTPTCGATFTGCMGLCSLGPVMIVEPEGTFYIHVTPEKACEIIDRHVIGGQIVEEYTYRDPETGKHIPAMKDIPFFANQVKIALRNCGVVDFASVESYIANGGFTAIAKALGMERADVVEEMKASGLRGRGGAGFPTGVKWEAGFKQQAEQKYIVCNADEGDPGAFMDRSVLESDPFGLIEGMMIAGYAIGASKGYVYVRAEYPIAVERLNAAIDQCREAALLGGNILGSGFQFDLEVRIGAGAFVCGEETALMHSVEGKRGEPAQKPPFPFEKGLFGCPTIINNVETLANVPEIINRGAEWFASYGEGRSKGTKVFALAGDIVNTGIAEVPMGCSLRDLIFKVGGGLPGGLRFKAVQLGGPSGGCITADYLDTPVTYEALTALGAIMGSGGAIVMSRNTCMVDTARFFLDFIQDESCGKCVPCRIGTKRMLEILHRITGGRGTMQDISDLEDLAMDIKDTAMCGLGQTAPNPVLSTLKYFRQEYIDHIQRHKCEAFVCAAMVKYRIDADKCRGCTLCKRNCPADAIAGEVRRPHSIDPAKCVSCGACASNCKFGAIEKYSGE